MLARTASQADAAATIIANAVDLPGHPAIVRRPASELQPDSDLGARLVTRDVGELSESEIEDALECRRSLRAAAARGGIDRGAALRLHGETVVVGAEGIETHGGRQRSRQRDGSADACLIRNEADSMSAIIRKIVTVVEETHLEMGRAGRAADPARRGDRGDRKSLCRPICRGPLAADRDWRGTRRIAVEEGGRGARHRGAKAQSYGKAAAVGENGELEHAAAILHPKMGAPVRKVLGKGAALIPSSKKRGGPGTTLDIPLGHKDAAFVRSHFDGMEVQINDAPRANEIMVAVAVTDSGRPLPRVGGLTIAEIKGEDGLR